MSQPNRNAVLVPDLCFKYKKHVDQNVPDWSRILFSVNLALDLLLFRAPRLLDGEI